MNANKGDWVRIYNVILNVGERGENLPEDTKKVPFEMWDKGFLVNDIATVGDTVEVETIIGRFITGELLEINPSFDVNFGSGVFEPLYIGKQLREMLGE
jgi:hypothetical protein